MRITKLLAVAATAFSAVACNGIAPTSPSATVGSDDATALVDSKASKDVDPVNDCRYITDVKLSLLRSHADIKVQAVYFKRGTPAQCGIAPDWSSRPQGRLLPTLNPFIAKVTETRPPSTVWVTARAPNGAQGTIQVGGSPDATVSSNDATALVDAKTLEARTQGSDCHFITDVKLSLLRSHADIEVQAVYFKRGTPARCGIAPDWSSRPQGRLLPTLNPFIAKVTRTRPPTLVQVTAQAPNGVQGSIRVR